MESRFESLDNKVSRRIRSVQDLEKRHLEIRVGINDRMIKLALNLWEMNKRRVLSEEGKEVMDEAEINEFVAPKAAEIDLMKKEEAIVLAEINEEVESLRKLSRKADLEVREAMG